MENWIALPGYELSHQVSSLGNVRTIDRTVNSWQGKKRRLGKTLAQIPSNRGYLRVMLVLNRKSKNVSVHKLICTAFHGPQPFEDSVVMHINDNKLDNRADNLKWGTQLENVRDAVSKGIKVPIAGRPIVATSVLTGEDVIFKSIANAHRELKIQNSNIQKVLKGERQKAGGFKFKYLN